MNKELKKIKPEDIYVSRLKGKRVRNEEGWERMEELPYVFQPLGDPLLDCVGELLLNGPIPTVQQLAESLNATVKELNVYFGLRTGMGAREFLSAYKMLIAKELLSSTNLTIEERCQPCYAPFVEATSLNVGSVNLGEAVYQNPIKDVRYCVQQIIENHKIPEVEVFEVGMIHTTRQLSEQFDFVKPILFAIVLGHEGAMPRNVAALGTMIAGVYENFPNREEVLWGITEAHRQDFELVKTALDLGASTVRIGFEDSNYLRPGVQVDNNAVMVAELTDILHRKGMAPMTPDEARAMLRIPPLAGKG